MKYLGLAVIMGCLISVKLSAAISIVYNLRIAETTKHLPEDNGKYAYKQIVTPFGQFRKRRDSTKLNLGGALETLIYLPNPYYFRVDMAVARITQKDRLCSSKSKTQVDDILFSAGYSWLPSKRVHLTVSGFLGIPTHKDLSLITLQFGTGHVGLGAQLDGAYLYSKHNNASIRAAARYIRFLERRVPISLDDKVSCGTFNVGNLVDLFISHSIKYGNHRFGCGYDQTFLFGARVKPFIDNILDKQNYIRSAFYASYRYYFSIINTESSVAGNISYSFDIFPKRFGFKRIVTFWVSWGINFS